MHDLRYCTLRCQTGYQPTGTTRLRVGLLHIAIGKQVVWAATGLARGLSKAVVKLAVLATGDVWDQPIKDGTVLLILVQPQVQEVAQKPSALGNTEAVNILQVASAGIALPSAAVLEEGSHITC